MNLYQGQSGEDYYNMRSKRRSDFLQQQRAKQFAEHITLDDIVLDFGCGNGGILANLECAHKIGVEVNELSVAEAEKKQIEIFADIQKVKKNSVDVVISNHALEHVVNPDFFIKEINRVLKPGGKSILVVPAENPFQNKFSKWVANDPDQHIFSWTPMSFGNLVGQCGLSIDKSFYRAIGHSKYNRPLAKISDKLYQISRHIMAAALVRYEVVCISTKLA